MIKDNIEKILGSVPQNVTIIAVTKTVGIEKIKDAVMNGITNIGENRLQEALGKYDDLKSLGLVWHLIGSLQTNKAKKAVEIFDLIHSVDSYNLASVIDKEAQKINKKQDVLLQVNISKEETKRGFFVSELENILPDLSKLGNINVKGLMTIAPDTNDENFIRDCFIQTRNLKNKINELNYFSHKLETLSMGMSNDYTIALEESSTMIRLGRAIFGDRS